MIQRVVNSNFWTLKSRFIFSRIGFAIQKGVELSLLPVYLSFVICCFGILTKTTMCNYFKLKLIKT
ncbi:hypothetical protein HanXRQr2_Chr08g0350771 [Helianthus annuus]|uniref:Uncharacterized protein n=1 Tax=Helianthus annuus TaxID=4232 RepID=A0A9K3IGL7_HELAN|nr:hypothetical protein HanXRQr2_Chr08g0350771 [Helianthus annuus]